MSSFLGKRRGFSSNSGNINGPRTKKRKVRFDVAPEEGLYRKQLEKLNVPELISMCKAKQLKTPEWYTDTDSDRDSFWDGRLEMVDALVDTHYGSSANFKKSSIDVLVVSSAELLVYGYVREKYIRKYKANYPQDLTRIFCEYLDHIWVIPDKFNGVMKRHGSILFRPPFPSKNRANHRLLEKDENIDMIIGSSRGFCRGIVNFELKCIKPGKDAIGIMSEIEECEKLQWIAATKGNSYYYTSGSGIYSGKGTVNSPPEQYIDSHIWQIGDRVKMTVDLDASLCSFYKNKVQIGKTIKIEPNCTYHPVLATSVDMCEYELILERK